MCKEGANSNSPVRGMRKAHYHIRWADNTLDWEAFETERDAHNYASKLVRPGEKYTVEKSATPCPRCDRFLERFGIDHE